MKIKVRVTKSHIKKGTAVADCCPIALALKARGFSDPTVTQDSIEFSTKGEHKLEFKPSPRVVSFIDKFDEQIEEKGSSTVRPFTLVLTL